MAVKSKNVAVTTSPTLLFNEGKRQPGANSNFGRSRVVIRNIGTVDVYVGGPDVTTANGMVLKTGEPMQFSTVSDFEIIWAVSSSGTQNVRVLWLE